MTDLILETPNPEALDRTINQLGAALEQNPDGTYVKVGGGYRARIFNGNLQFLKFAIENQGYAKILGEIEE